MANTLLENSTLNVHKWRRYIEQEIGFILPDIQLQWLMNAVATTAAHHRLTVVQLWHQLANNSELRQQLLDAVIIPESRFFRHLPSIAFITDFAKKTYQQEDANPGSDSPFRVWSVGCASGQEAWTVAMSLAAEGMSQYHILGTDVSEKALDKARLAVYEDRQRCLIPQDCQQFVHFLDSDQPPHRTDTEISSDTSTRQTLKTTEKTWQVAPRLKSHVNFVCHNIFTPTYPTPHLQDVIICQNMLLYFRKFDQRDILTRLAAQCAVGGYIVLAPGEALFWRPKNMRRIVNPQINAWQKISA